MGQSHCDCPVLCLNKSTLLMRQPVLKYMDDTIYRDVLYYLQVMKMGIFRRKRQTTDYDRSRLRPVIRASICTGEQVAGFRELATGKFHDVMLIRNEKDLKRFMEQYGVKEEEISKEY